MPAGADRKHYQWQHKGANSRVSEDATPSPREVEFMALVLEGRHGRFAAEVAEFFSSVHAHEGDAGRSWAWAGVAETVRKRERQRLTAG